ncbi:MAG: pilus assembly protein [Rhodospirillales bacterium]|nr:pilus assembly protein [Rhodospirillales bacterium]
MRAPIRLRHPRALRADRRGVVAIELAMLTPLLMLMFFGCLEISQLARANKVVTNAAETIADLAAREGDYSAAAIANVCHGGKLVLSPFDASTLKVAIASVTHNAATGTTTTDWQDTSCGSANRMANPVASAGNLVAASGDSVIVVQASYTYTALTSMFLPLHYTLTQTAFARPH